MKHPAVLVKPNIPNCITTLRIAGTVLLLFLTPLTAIFYVIYILCGFSDVLDGWIARKSGTISEFGAKLDSIADLMFYAVVLIKLLPILWKLLPAWIWYFVGSIVLLRLVSYLTAGLKFRRFASLHTKANKLTGAAVFLLPCFITLPCAVEYCVLFTGIACISTVEELILHIVRKEYHSNTKALF